MIILLCNTILTFLDQIAVSNLDDLLDIRVEIMISLLSQESSFLNELMVLFVSFIFLSLSCLRLRIRRCILRFFTKRYLTFHPLDSLLDDLCLTLTLKVTRPWFDHLVLKLFFLQPLFVRRNITPLLMQRGPRRF